MKTPFFAVNVADLFTLCLFVLILSGFVNAPIWLAFLPFLAYRILLVSYWFGYIRGQAAAIHTWDSATVYALGKTIGNASNQRANDEEPNDHEQ